MANNLQNIFIQEVARKAKHCFFYSVPDFFVNRFYFLTYKKSHRRFTMAFI